MKFKNMIEENNDKSSFFENRLGDGFYVLRFRNDSTEINSFSRPVDQQFIQFHFCLKGEVDFNFNAATYTFNINEEHAMLLYNPQKPLPIEVSLGANSWLISVLISIKKFHSLFSPDADQISFLSIENSMKKFYDKVAFSPSMAVVLSQILNTKVHDSMKTLYFKGKVYELLSLYFNKNEDTSTEQCPFLVDEKNVNRIRLAKDILIERMTEPPSLEALASEIGLNIKKLKDGFKQLYGDTVYSYLLDHKMEEARRMLDSKQHNVNEVGLKLGYSTSSHFIAAFKKKFGTTPKKYLMSVSS
ncbi:AraC family transcriptional regulator [Flavobacteriaceae bacterium]|nr:AraC family transcriptional regulator [Flavobacteriaceae bacterium]